MSELELKSGMVQLISKLRNRESLKELKELIELFVRNHAGDADYWEDLNVIEQAELKKALAESENENNLIAHEDVMKKYKKGFNK